MDPKVIKSRPNNIIIYTTHHTNKINNTLTKTYNTKTPNTKKRRPTPKLPAAKTNKTQTKTN